MDLAGTRVGGYRLHEELGSGGMGTVYRAVAEDGRVAAIKLIHPQLLGSDSALERFVREAAIGQRLDHANIVRTISAESYEADGTTHHALVMEYVEGQTLSDMKKELGHLPDELCRHIGGEVARALSAIHDAGVIHRDIKPSNILVTPEHEIKVMDLGVAMLVDEAMRMTQTGEFLGSVLYAAPEQFHANADLDGRCDLYALGVTLYELATGRHPFGGKPAFQIVPDDLTASTATSINPNLSPFLDEVIRTLLAADPDQRPLSARAVADLFEAGEAAHWWRDRAAERWDDDAASRRQLPVPRDTALYGRERDLERLQASFDESAAGRGQAILLRGEAGVGKTRLVADFVASLDLPHHFLFGNYPPGGAATGSGAFAAAFLHHFGEQEIDDSLARHLPELAAIVPAFAAMLRGTPLPGDAEALGIDGVRAAFLQLARSLSQEKPLVLFVDDLQYAPEAGRGLFASLADSIGEYPILLLGAIRPDAHEEWAASLTRHGRVHPVSIERLGVPELSEMLVEAFGSQELADEYAYSIALKSDCNPFFALEIVRDLQERGEVVRAADGSWTSSGFLKDIRVPASVRELIEHRLRHLAPEEQDLLEIAACCGPRFDPAVVTAVAGEPLVPTLKRFRDIERKHHLIRAEGREYVFDHQQVQEALYEMSFVQLREQYHAAIGATLEERTPEPEGENALRICHHHLLGGQADRSRPHLRAALKHLQEQHLHQRQVELTTHALASDALPAPERADTLLARAGAARALGDAASDVASAEEAVAIATDLDDATRMVRGRIVLGTAHCMTGNYAEAGTQYAVALELAASSDDTKMVISAHRGLGMVNLMTGELAEAQVHYDRALALAVEAGSLREQVPAHVNLGNLLPALGKSDEALAHLEEAVRIGKEIGELRNVGMAHSGIGRILYGRGDLAGALDGATRFRDAMREIGDRRGEVAASIVMCAIWRSMGALDEMARDLDYARKWGERTGDRWMESYAHFGAGWIAEQKEDPAAARRAYERALELREAINAAEEIADVHAALGNLDAAAGDTESARAHYEAAIRIAKEPLGDATTLAQCGRAWIGDQSVEEAAACVARAQDSIPLSTRVLACETLGRASGEDAYFEQATGWLNQLLAQVPPERRNACRERIAVHRRLLARG